ncbi:MAG: hypothetical protein MRT15_10635 [archaeon YNP-LCB-003-016]|nr:hypothetical protein [Candidatus Culexarchaeum yellowstonense]MCR6692838.1 hypothetical protein [Candidatus Culexarchaeum yellowstonense]
MKQVHHGYILSTEKDRRELRSIVESQAIKEVENKLRRRGVAD